MHTPVLAALWDRTMSSVRLNSNHSCSGSKDSELEETLSRTRSFWLYLTVPISPVFFFNNVNQWYFILAKVLWPSLQSLHTPANLSAVPSPWTYLCLPSAVKPLRSYSCSYTISHINQKWALLFYIERWSMQRLRKLYEMIIQDFVAQAMTENTKSLIPTQT